MKETLPRVINPFVLANQMAELQGLLELSKMPRLAPLLNHTVGQVRVDLQFGRDQQQCCWVRGKIAAEVELPCQRCEKGVVIHLEAHPVLSPVMSDSAAAKLSSEYEPLMLDEDHMVALIDLVEEELILVLPMFAKHPIGECSFS